MLYTHWTVRLGWGRSTQNKDSMSLVTCSKRTQTDLRAIETDFACRCRFPWLVGGNCTVLLYYTTTSIPERMRQRKPRQTYALARSPRHQSQIPHPIELYLGYGTHSLPRNSFQSFEAHSFEVGAMLLGLARIESVEHQYPVTLRRCCFPEAARHNVASVYTQRSESHTTYLQQRDSCCARWYDFCFSRVVHRQVILWCSD